jgi:hypothetical protein
LSTDLWFSDTRPAIYILRVYFIRIIHLCGWLCAQLGYFNGPSFQICTDEENRVPIGRLSKDNLPFLSHTRASADSPGRRSVSKPEIPARDTSLT